MSILNYFLIHELGNILLFFLIFLKYENLKNELRKRTLKLQNSSSVAQCCTRLRLLSRKLTFHLLSFVQDWNSIDFAASTVPMLRACFK